MRGPRLHSGRTRCRTGCLLIAVLLATAPGEARTERLDLRSAALDLPGPPALVIPTDLDRDGHRDLVVVVAFTEIQEIGGDRIEDLVQVTTVIPALFDRREVRFYRGEPDGGYALVGSPFRLPPSVLNLEPGPEGLELVALTDQGLSALRPDPGATGLRLTPVLEDPPVLAHTGAFYPSLRLVQDLDGDGDADVLIPTDEGLSIYTWSPAGPRPASRIPLPGSVPGRRWHPMPRVRHVNGDGFPDLVFEKGLDPSVDQGPAVLLGRGDGSFEPLRPRPVDCHDDGSQLRMAGFPALVDARPRDVVTLRDLDGDRRAEVVLSRERDRGDGLRAALKEARRPLQDYRFHDLTPDLAVETAPYFGMVVTGHTVDADLTAEGLPFRIASFQDLDGDGRQDLVSVTLDFSVLQALKILVTRKVGIGLDFHVYCQTADRRFREVTGLDLDEKLKLDLDNLKLGRFAQFAGDFDGDGRQDFVHLGRGRRITIHRGGPGCRFPRDPDLVLELEEEPPSLDLVYIEDLDGDGRADLRITRPLPPTSEDVSAPVRMELHLSGDGP